MVVILLATIYKIDAVIFNEQSVQLANLTCVLTPEDASYVNIEDVLDELLYTYEVETFAGDISNVHLDDAFQIAYILQMKALMPTDTSEKLPKLSSFHATELIDVHQTLELARDTCRTFIGEIFRLKAQSTLSTSEYLQVQAFDFLISELHQVRCYASAYVLAHSDSSEYLADCLWQLSKVIVEKLVHYLDDNQELTLPAKVRLTLVDDACFELCVKK